MQEDKDVPMLLLGGSGSGKSSVLCCAASSVLAKVEQGLLPVPGSVLSLCWQNSWLCHFLHL